MYVIRNCTFTQCYPYALFPAKMLPIKMLPIKMLPIKMLPIKMLPIRMLPIPTKFKIFYQYKRLSIENVIYKNFVHTDQ